ncbi:hypothetical protein J6590_076144 [Homalodisca vitripennis]|nr:hypothetical protein J6590_076144 [Homalodisca vitripennis]
MASTVPLEVLGISLGLNSLVKRRQLLDVVFLHKLINGDVNCSELLRRIDFQCLIRPGPFTLSAVVSTQPVMYITALSRDFTDLETSSPPGMTFAVIVLCT